MAITGVAMREALAIAYGSNATFATLHTADPGTTITNEVTGAGYARQALTWTAGASDGVVTASVTFTVPANVATTHAGLVSASTGGVLHDKVAAVYNSQPSSGTVTVNFTFTES